MQLFVQDWRCEVVAGAVDEVMGLLARSSGPGRGYEVVVGVGDCFRSQWVVEGRLVCSFSQGRGHGLWAGGGGMVDGVVGSPARSFGENRRRKHGSWTMGLRW